MLELIVSFFIGFTEPKQDTTPNQTPLKDGVIRLSETRISED